MNAIHDAERLKELQALPLHRKIQITQTRIIEWYIHFGGNVCVSFSGGKDSTVLLHIARQIYPDIPAVFSNTGLEFPEIQKFVRGFDNITIVTPEMRFTDVIQTYGYPLIGKEVADAIYYARRIRTDDLREREKKREETHRVARTTSYIRREISGNRIDGGRRTTSSKRVQRDTKGQSFSDDCPTWGDGEWHDWRRGCL